MAEEVRAELQGLALAPSHAAPSDAAPLHGLPLELLPRILARLPTNEVPCTARLVCKTAAAALSSSAHTTVRLSQPSPHGEFARRWGAPGAMRPLTLDRRRRLLCLTATSGCLRNLAWLAEHVGCSPDDSVLEAAAAAGRLEACRWLLQQSGDGLSAALAAAAGAGQQSTLEALLAERGAHFLMAHGGEDFRATLASYAARAGHVGLVDWLLERFWLSGPQFVVPPMAKTELLAAAAAGCDLATLQRLHSTQRLQLSQLIYMPDRVLGCAASSRTPDWRAKVEWAEACLGAPGGTTACTEAAACPDALERLAWLRARGCACDGQAVILAANAGNAEALSYLLAEGCVADDSAFMVAALGGHVGVLEALHSRGLATSNPGAWANVALAAARGGHVPVVRWMLERRLIDLRQPAALHQETLIGAAAASGSVELLALLRAAGCRWGEDALYAATGAGSEEALEWLVAQGYPVQESDDGDDDPYLRAVRQGDWATLACLGRLAVPWRSLDREGGTFTNALQYGYSVPMLRRLLELGCPVDWVRAREAVKHFRDADVRALLGYACVLKAKVRAKVAASAAPR